MAVLSDQELWALIGFGRFVIDPPPQPNAVSPSTIDLTLANDFRVPHVGGGGAAEVVIDTRESASAMKALFEFSEELTVADDSFFHIEPGAFVLAWTRERIGLPSFLAARIEGRSTLARLGLSVHQSAPTRPSHVPRAAPARIDQRRAVHAQALPRPGDLPARRRDDGAAGRGHPRQRPPAQRRLSARRC